MGVSVASQLIGLHELCRKYDKKASRWHYASLAFLAPLYQIVLCGAAAVAVYKYATGDTTWYRTGRASEHRGVGARVVPAAVIASSPVDLEESAT
jgi:hypothetical protein